MSYRILSIDGGGVRGLIPGVVLCEIEKRLGKPLTEHFDLISGTSAGGQIALAITRAAKDGSAYWTAEGIDELYARSFEKIFPFKKGLKMNVLRGVTTEKYSSDGFESVLEELFGDSLLSEARVETLIPAYEVEKGIAHFFTRAGALENPDEDHSMRFVARSTSSAPIFFEPNQHQGKEKAYIDGAVFANNPAMCAFAHALSLGFDEDDMTVVSLGTGSISRDIRFDEAKDWGLVHWARPLFDITSQASNLSIDWQLSHILRKAHYFRITPTFKDGRSAIDDARPENMASVREIGLKMISEQSSLIDQICTRIS